jgi:hypothetical protein
VLYAEPGTDPAALERMAKLLTREREILRALVGHEPPVLRVAIVTGERKVMQDADGEPVWTISRSDVDRDRAAVATLVHEWTHAIAKQQGLTGDDSTRFFEDGLCDLLAHLALRALRPQQPSPLLEERRRALDLHANGLGARVDLLALGGKLSDRAEGSNSFEAITAAFCNNPLTIAGYSLGLAYWLEHLERNPRLVREFFAKLTPDIGKSGTALVNLVESLAPKASRASAFEVRRARATLRRAPTFAMIPAPATPKSISR